MKLKRRYLLIRTCYNAGSHAFILKSWTKRVGNIGDIYIVL